MPFICPICQGIYLPPGACPHCVSNAIKLQELQKFTADQHLVGVLMKEAKFFYPNLSHDEILVAALEELLAQNRSK